MIVESKRCDLGEGEGVQRKLIASTATIRKRDLLISAEFTPYNAN